MGIIFVSYPCLFVYAEEITNSVSSENVIEVPDKPDIEFVMQDSMLDRLPVGTDVTHRVLIYAPQGEPVDEVFTENPEWEQELITAPKGMDSKSYQNSYLYSILTYINDHQEYISLEVDYDWSGSGYNRNENYKI